MNGNKVGVFEQVDQAVFGNLLPDENGFNFFDQLHARKGSMTLQYCLTLNTSGAKNVRLWASNVYV
jgi:hypothetical protein